MRKKTVANVDIALDQTSNTPLYQQVYEFLHDAVIAGSLPEGSKLPSIRQASQSWGVSRPTVERAYMQLVVEGYVDNVARSGYVVRRLDAGFLRNVSTHRQAAHVEQPRERTLFFSSFMTDPRTPYDFAFARLDPKSFPIKTWLGLTSDALYRESENLMCSYSADHVPNGLRRALAGYLRRTRSVVCAPEQVAVLPSTEFALETILQLFDRGQDMVGVEEPGYLVIVDVARRLGFDARAIASDRGEQRLLDDICRIGPKVVFVTPSHQFPTGTVMPLSARIELLKWAEDNDAYIIEDDSCSEYRYSTSPVPSLQSLDANGRVVYLGNFSKILAPGLRVAYAVVPDRLLGRYHERFMYTSSAVSLLTQHVLASFIEEGHLDQHVRKMVSQNRIRHDLLLEHLAETFGHSVELSGVDAGMHLYATVHNGMDQDGLVSSAREQGARVYRSDLFWFEHEPAPNTLLLGFSAIDRDLIAPGVEALGRAWL